MSLNEPSARGTDDHRTRAGRGRGSAHSQRWPRADTAPAGSIRHRPAGPAERTPGSAPAAADGLLASLRPRHREARVWHLAEAAIGVDETTAALLEELGRRGAAGRLRGSLRHLRESRESGRRRAPSSTPSGGRQRRLQRRPVRPLPTTAGTAPRGVATLPSPPSEAITHLQAQLDTWSTDPASAARLLQVQAQRISTLDPILSIKLSVDATAAAALSGQLRLASELAERQWRSLAPPGRPPSPPVISWSAASRPCAATAISPCRCLIAVDRRSTTHPLPRAGPTPGLPRDVVPLHRRLRPRTRRCSTGPSLLAREHGAIGILPFAIAHLASSKYRMGEWDAAYADATEALALAEDSGRLLDRPIALVMLGLIDAARGDSRAPERAREAIDGGSAVGAQFVVAQGLSILGLYELSTGHPAAAIAPLEQCGDMAVELGPDGTGLPPVGRRARRSARAIGQRPIPGHSRDHGSKPPTPGRRH